MPPKTTAKQIEAFNEWLRTHPSPKQRYRASGKCESFQFEAADEKESNCIVPDATNVHCTVRDTFEADQAHPSYKQWECWCYICERISFNSLAHLNPEKFAELKAAGIQHGDMIDVSSSQYRGTGMYICYGPSSDLALVKTGREYGDSIPTEFADAPNGYLGDFVETRDKVTVDVLPGPMYLRNECDLKATVVKLWQRAAKIPPAADADPQMGYTAAKFAVPTGDPETDGFLSYAEEEDNDEQGGAEVFTYLGSRPRMQVLLREMKLAVDAGGDIDAPVDAAAAAAGSGSKTVADADKWWNGLDGAEKYTVYERNKTEFAGDGNNNSGNNFQNDGGAPLIFSMSVVAAKREATLKDDSQALLAKESGSRRDRDGDAEQQQQQPPNSAAVVAKPLSQKEKTVVDEPVAEDADDSNNKQKKASPKKASPKKAAAKNDDDDDAAAEEDDAESKKKKAAAAADASHIKFQFRSNLDGDTDDDNSWTDYAEDVSKKLEEQYSEKFLPAKTKTKKVRECDVSATHMVDFKHMMQFAKDDPNRQRPIRRVSALKKKK